MDRHDLGTSFPPSHLGKVIPLNHLELIDLLSTSFFILKKLAQGQAFQLLSIANIVDSLQFFTRELSIL